MDKETFEGMQVKKRERQKRIVDAVGRFPIQTQLELVEILRKHYKIKTNQSTVSRDIDDLMIERDPEDNRFIPGVTARRNKEANKLARLFFQADVKSVDEMMDTKILKGSVNYMTLVASQIESMLAVDEIEIHTFLGQNGSLAIYYPTKDRDRVEKVFSQIIQHVEKIRTNGAK
ncbi:hypothetical protein [Bacillus sp. SJS]|uniref:hypothetical protein n=1 Tax=Bacillus sp. SJS TaxID=1423321 RepID=UPI0004DCD022|nr:hypothetical protein [Bacillus sp. SJS]KZZ85046.1 hypothetical protein AS29_008335 [Bacillus sp. SJS]